MAGQRGRRRRRWGVRPPSAGPPGRGMGSRAPLRWFMMGPQPVRKPGSGVTAGQQLVYLPLPVRWPKRSVERSLTHNLHFTFPSESLGSERAQGMCAWRNSEGYSSPDEEFSDGAATRRTCWVPEVSGAVGHSDARRMVVGRPRLARWLLGNGRFVEGSVEIPRRGQPGRGPGCPPVASADTSRTLTAGQEPWRGAGALWAV